MPVPIQTVGYLKYMQPWLQAAGQGAKNAFQAGKIGAGNLWKRVSHTPIQQKFTPKTFDEILAKVPSTDDAFIKALDTYRGASTGAPVTFEELQGIAALAKSNPQLKHLEKVVTNYIKNSGIDAAGLQGIGLTNQATKWNALTNALQPGHTLKFDPLTRTLQAVDGTGQAIRRFSPLKTSLVAAGTGGTIWGGVEGYGAISDMLEEMTPAEYIANISGNKDYKEVSKEPATVDAPVADTPQGTENLPPADQAPTPPVRADEPPASAKPEVPAEVPAAPAAPATPAADPSFVDKALQWGRDNPDLVSLLSLLAVGAGGVGLYNLLDDDEEEEDEEEEY